jgi:hypothetical protein
VVCADERIANRLDRSAIGVERADVALWLLAGSGGIVIPPGIRN